MYIDMQKTKKVYFQDRRHMYINGKMRPVETIPGTEVRGYKGE
jgi:hypothetical protein